MPPTTKESVDTAAPSNVSPNSGGGPGANPHPNPVCLDVPVVIRNLPAGNGTSDLPPAGLFEEHARTVIVFDKGAVLRVSAELPVGQEVVVSNSQGREAVCRLARTPNLPNIKGFVEIEFLDSISDFWGFQQPVPQTNVPVPSAPSLAPESEAPRAISAPQAADSTDQEGGVPAGGAPSFDDIAGVMPMSAVPEPDKPSVMQDDAPKSPVAPETTPQSEKKPEEKRINAAKPAGPTATKGIAKQTPTASIKDCPDHPSASAKRNDLLGKSILGSSQAPTPKKSRGNAVPLLVAAILILAAIVTAYFLLYRGGVPSFIGKASSPAPLPAVLSSVSVHSSAARDWKSAPPLPAQLYTATSNLPA